MINPRLLSLSIDFLLDRKLTVREISEDDLIVGMRDTNDREAIDLIHFGTGLEIKPIPINDTEWMEWHQRYSELITSGYVDRRRILQSKSIMYVTIGNNIVKVVVKPDYENTFPIEDKSGLVRLRKQFGSGCQVRIKILAEAARELALSEAPDDAEGILLALERQSPLKLADMVWSSPVSDGATTRLSLVRKAWFRQQLASVRRNLSPSSLIIMDEAGRLFDDTSKRSLLVPAGATLIGTLILVAGVLAFGGRHDPRLVGTDPSGHPSGLPASKASIPPQLEGAPAEPAVANAGTSPANFELVGVVGRLPRDAVALVRPPWGKVVTLRIGDSLLGWRLTSLSADRVTLTKGTTSRDITLKPVAAPER